MKSTADFFADHSLFSSFSQNLVDEKKPARSVSLMRFEDFFFFI